MSNRPPISWSAAIRDMRADRATPAAAIREVPLRVSSAMHGPGRPLSAWRGRSGRRYVVGIHDLTVEAAQDVGGAVVIAVRRDAAGIAEIAAVADAGRIGSLTRWIAAAAEAGATELHVHRLAEDEAGRRAIVADLADDAPIERVVSRIGRGERAEYRGARGYVLLPEDRAGASGEVA